MKPSKVKAGTKLKIHPLGNPSLELDAFFVERTPTECGHPAVNYLRVPAYAGLNGADDIGICQMSDYELSRRGEYAL